MSTAQRRLVPGEPGQGGYRRLEAADGEAHAVRDDLAGASLPGDWRRSARPLLVLAHLSDTHVMDHQSPGRAELLDRYSDPDSPVRAEAGIIGTYRAQELFTFQVAEAMCRAVREHGRGPVSGAPADFAVITGDASDNCQRNELRAYLGLLDGGIQIRPDSGDPQRYEGVSGPEVADERYWHPGPAEPDLPRTRYGFPAAPGVLDAARRPFLATGLGLPWYAVHGNHDNMLFWQITTASHIDWPQQGRIIELLRTDQGLAIACTVIDSAAPPTYTMINDAADLAALSRELSANDWQVRDQITADGGTGAGTAADRNAILTLDWPRTAEQAAAQTGDQA